MAARANASLAPWLGIAAAVIVLDQLTKAMIVAAFRLGAGAAIIGAVQSDEAKDAGRRFAEQQQRFRDAAASGAPLPPGCGGGL